MTTRQFAETGIASRGPTADEDSMALTSLPIDTELSGGSSTPVVVEDMNMNRIDSAIIERTYQLQPTNISQNALYLGLEAITPEIATVNEAGQTQYVPTEVSTAIATFIAKTNMGNRTVRLEHSITDDGDFDKFVSFVAGSLGEEASSAIDDALDGLNPETAIPVYATQDHATGTYVRNLDCWANSFVEGLTGISPWNSAHGVLRAGTMLTPRHPVFSDHYPPSIGTILRFVTSDNTVIERTLLSVLRVPTFDLMIGLLDSDLPSSITPCQIMADEVGTKLPNLDQRIPTLCLDKEEKATVSDWAIVQYLGPTGGYQNVMYEPEDATRLDFYEPKVSGDSGNPCFAIIDGRLVLLTVWLGGFGGSGTATQAYLTEIQSTIDTLGAFGHTIDVVDLSSYPSY